MSLPAALRERGKTTFEPGSWRRSWLKTSRGSPVLIVDDDALVGEMYRLALVRSGYEVLVAKDGATGLQVAAASSPALIFLDIRMPHMDGVEVLRHLAASEGTRHIPVVMLSNYDDGGQIKHCLALGAKEYVVKVNISPADLAGIASRWIG